MPSPCLDEIERLLDLGCYSQAFTLAVELDSSAPEGPRGLALLGRLHRELGRYSQAEPPLLQALSGLSSSVGKEHPLYAATLHELGRLYEETGRHAGAEKLFRTALEIRQQTLGQEHPDVALSLYDLAALLDLLSRFADSADLVVRCLEMRRRLLGEAHPDFALSLTQHAVIDYRRGRLRLAEQATRRAVEILRASRGEQHPEYATGILLLSRLTLQAAQLDEASKLAEQVCDIQRQTRGEKHPRHARALSNLALVRAIQGRHEESEPLARRAVELVGNALGERHSSVADSLTILGCVLQVRRDPVEASTTFLRAIDIYRASYGELHAHLAGCWRDLAEAGAARAQFAEAEEHYRRATAILERHGTACLHELVEATQGLARILVALGRHPEASRLARGMVDRIRNLGSPSEGENEDLLLASALDGYARVLHLQGRLSEAEAAWREVADCRARSLGEDHPLHADTLRCLAGLYLAQGNFPQAQELMERSLAVMGGSLGTEHSQYVETMSNLAELCLQKGDVSRAESLLGEAVEIQKRRLGTQHPGYAHAVANLARLYLAMNNIPAAEVRYREVIGILEETHGEEHPEYARALVDLARLYFQGGDLGTSEMLFSRARDIRQRDPGEHHPDYALTLHGLAQVYQAMNRLDEAEPLFRQAVQIHETTLGLDNPSTLRLLHSLGLFEQARGEFRRAEQHLTRVRDRLTHLLGTSAPALVPLLGDLARLYQAGGDHLRAEPLWRWVLDIDRAARPEDHLLLAQDLINLALCMRALAELPEAEQLVREAVGLLEKGPSDATPTQPGTETFPSGESGAGLGLLAGILLDQERYDEARAVFDEALARTRAAVGQAHPAVASLLAEVARLEMTRGRPADALTLYSQAREMTRRAQGEDHPDHLHLLRLQAVLHQSLGQFDQAEQLLRQRLNALRRVFGPSALILVPGQQPLADLFRAQGRLEEAETLCRQSLELMRSGKAESVEDPDEKPGAASMFGRAALDPPQAGLGLALAENNLATVCLAQGRPEDAEPLLVASLAELKNSVGEEHPAFIGSLLNLAGLYATSGRQCKALETFDRLTTLEARLLPPMLAHPSERHRAFSCHSFHDNYEAYLGIAVPLLRQHEDGLHEELTEGDVSYRFPVAVWRRRLFDLVLKWKRFGIEILGASPLGPLTKKHPHLAPDLRRLWLLDRQITAKRQTGPGLEGLVRHEESIATWLTQREELEERLAWQVPALLRRRRLREVDTARVSAALPKGWALVEFVHYRRRLETDRSEPTTSVREAEEGRFVVFVLKAEETTPELVDLGPAAPITEWTRAWRAGLESGRAEPAGEAFREGVWKGVLPLVEGCTGLVVAPDSEMYHLALDVLPLPGGGLLGERFEIRQVLSGRDLLRWSEAAEKPQLPALVVGDPTGAPAPTSSTRARWWNVFRRTTTPRRIETSPVTGSQAKPRGAAPAAPPAPPPEPWPGSRAEAQTVGKLLEVAPWLGDSSLRRQVVESPSAGIVHLSAPAFFHPEPAGQFTAAWQPPLSRSGLVLGREEHLTSLDITEWDLEATRLVMLPTCETRPELGRTWSKVCGLISAFVQAGARNVVMCLWRPPEPARLALVQAFYRAVGEGRSVPEALWRARMATRARHPAPVAWAGWICISMSSEEKLRNGE